MAKRGFTPLDASRPKAAAAVSGRGAAPAGFTMLELLIAMGIAVIIGAVLFMGLSNYRSKNDLTATASELVSSLREAQSRSVAQASSTGWGVHFGNATATAPFFALFAGTYGATTTVGYYRLPPTVQYVSATVPLGGSVDVVFSQLTGSANASATITIQSTLQKQPTSTITVNANGSISY